MRIDKEKAVNDAILSTKYREGRDHERRILALEFLKIGNTLEQVSKATGLDIETLQKLKSEDGEDHRKMAHALINLSDEHLQLCTIAGVFGLYSHKSYNHPLFSLPCITFTQSDSGLITPSGVVLILCCKAKQVTGPKFPSDGTRNKA